jgi:hypothetical protein
MLRGGRGLIGLAVGFGTEVYQRQKEKKRLQGNAIGGGHLEGSI